LEAGTAAEAAAAAEACRNSRLVESVLAGLIAEPHFWILLTARKRALSPFFLGAYPEVKKHRSDALPPAKAGGISVYTSLTARRLAAQASVRASVFPSPMRGLVW